MRILQNFCSVTAIKRFYFTIFMAAFLLAGCSPSDPDRDNCDDPEGNCFVGATFSIESVSRLYVSANVGAYTSTDIIWKTDAVGATFAFKKGLSCSSATALTGTNISGTTSGQETTSTINASSLDVGLNSVIFCLSGSDIYGNEVSGSQTTFIVRDDTVPTVLGNAPANAGVGGLNVVINATFSEPMDAGTANSTNVTLTQGATPISGSVAISGNTVTFTPSGALTNALVYTADFGTGLRDRAGNAIAAAQNFSFTATTLTAALWDTGGHCWDSCTKSWQ